MSRVFAYVRVSTTEQTTENQCREIETAGFRVELHRVGDEAGWLALGGVNLMSPAWKMTMGVINAVAQFERDLLIERTQSGLARRLPASP